MSQSVLENRSVQTITDEPLDELAVAASNRFEPDETLISPPSVNAIRASNDSTPTETSRLLLRRGEATDVRREIMLIGLSRVMAAKDANLEELMDTMATPGTGDLSKT